MKICNKCGAEKEIVDFVKDHRIKSGLGGWCKDCARQHQQSAKCKKAHKEAQRKYKQSKKGRATQQRKDVKYRVAYPEKIKARHVVSHAIRDGKLKRPSICEFCKEKRFVHGHHEDYSKPLDVVWLCRECHKELHRK